MTTTAATVPVSLAAGHTEPGCFEMSWQLLKQLSNGYRRGASTMPLPSSFEEYLDAHRTARKRSARARRLGYRFDQIDRRRHEQDVYDINTSAPRRQGRPMSAGYHERPRFSDNPIVCPLHHVYTYGVLRHDRLVAYLWLYRCGELAMVSSILGHADRLTDDIMYLLATETIRVQHAFGGTLFYNLHRSGTDGLRFFKERIGLAPAEVEWLL
jgi:hypothetical protein